MAAEAPFRCLESFVRHGETFLAGAELPEAARRWPDLREKQRAGLVAWEEGREHEATATRERRLRLAPPAAEVVADPEQAHQAPAPARAAPKPTTRRRKAAA